MANVGINLTMTENVSSVAPKISESLRNISQAGEDMGEALQLGDLEEKYKAFADRVDKIHDMQKANQREITKGVQTTRGIETLRKAPEEVLRTTTGAVQRVGATGDVTEAAPGFMQMLKGMLSSLGPVGMAVGGVAGTLGAGALVASVLSKQYEKVLPEMMDLTAIMGELGSTSEETSESFKRTMDEASASAAEFGYSLEIGAGVMKTFAEVAGMGREAAAAGAARVSAYARGMGVAPGALGRAEAIGRRFGQPEVLGYALGGLEASGMGRGQYQEFLTATLNIFEEGISKGIIRAVPEIATTQAWIAQMGEAYKGQYGLAFYRKLEGATAGATSLQAERDIVLYRAAKRALGGEAGELEIMKFLEKGPNQKMIRAVGEIVQETTGGVLIDSVRMMTTIFGSSYKQAEDLVNFLKTGEFLKAIDIVQPPDAKSREMDLLSIQENIMNDVRGIGKEMLPMKVGILTSAYSLVEMMKNFVTGDRTDEMWQMGEKAKEAQEYIREIIETSTVGQLPGAGGYVGGEETIWPELIDKIKELIGTTMDQIKANQELTEELKKPVEVETETAPPKGRGY